MSHLSTAYMAENYSKLLRFIDNYITGERKDKLKKLYEDHAERIAFMPASGTEHYHNCFPGGYVDHVIRVVEAALELRALWSRYGATLLPTEEELVFAALNHDLGKIGTEQAPQYIPNDSEWHRKNQGKLYKNNPANPFMTVPDRSLKLLADRGIAVSEAEWYGIKLHDGMYEEANKAYYVSYDPSSRLRTDLPYILHQADLLAARVEYEQWVVRSTAKPEANKPALASGPGSGDMKAKFDALFNQ